MKKIGQLEEEEQFDTCMGDHVFSDEYQIKKQRLLNSVEKSQRKVYKFRSMTSIAAAAALVLGLSVTTYAAVKGIRASISEDKEKDKVTYEVNKESDEYIPPIEITAGYLPEGYKEWAPGKYSPNGEKGVNGISIVDVGWLKKGKSVDVSNYEEQQVGEAHAVIVEKKGYEYPWNIYLFYEEEGHAVEVMGCDELSKEEMLKVCEGITYKEAPELDPDGTYQAFSIESLNDNRGESAQELVTNVSSESIRGLNQSFEIDGINYTVTDINITDKVNTALLNEENTVDYSEVKDCIQEDGTFVPFNRTVEEWRDGELQTKELGSTPVKNVEITLTVENTKAEADEDVFVGPMWYKMKKSEEGAYQLTDEIPGYDIDESFRGFNFYKIGCDLPYYFDSSSYPGDQHFFYMALGAGEKKDVHVWMAIPEDELEQAYVTFSGGMDEYVKIKQD